MDHRCSDAPGDSRQRTSDRTEILTVSSNFEILCVPNKQRTVFGMLNHAFFAEHSQILCVWMFASGYSPARIRCLRT